MNNTPAFDGATTIRSVDENMPAGTTVGDPVAATDADDDTLAYSLSGSMYFDVDSSGQITTTMALDYEAMSSHTVMVMVDDGRDEDNTATITVTIAVGDMYPGCTVAGNNGRTNDCEALLGGMDDLMGADATRTLNWSEDTPIEDWTA